MNSGSGRKKSKSGNQSWEFECFMTDIFIKWPNDGVVTIN